MYERGIFGSKEEEVTAESRMLHKEELNDLQGSYHAATPLTPLECSSFIVILARTISDP